MEGNGGGEKKNRGVTPRGVDKRGARPLGKFADIHRVPAGTPFFLFGLQKENKSLENRGSCLGIIILVVFILATF